MNILNEIESAVLKFWRISLFLRYSFSRLFNTLHACISVCFYRSTDVLFFDFPKHPQNLAIALRSIKNCVLECSV